MTRERVQARTREVTLRAGRIAPHVSQLDYEEAKRELTGESEMDRQDAILDSNLAPGPPHRTGASGAI